MKKRLCIFGVLFVLGLILFQGIIFKSYEIAGLYDSDNITQFTGLVKEGNTFFKEKENSQIIINIPECTLNGFKLRFALPLTDDMEIKLFYADENQQSFSEENIITKKVFKGVTEVFFSLKENDYTSFKLELKSDENMSFEFNCIELLRKETNHLQRNALYFTKLICLLVFCGMLSLLLGNFLDNKLKTKISKEVVKKPRDTNIELLRILCMLVIIAHHCVVHGGSINTEYCTNKIISIFLLPGGKIGFTCFLAISTWFLADTCFQTKRFVKMWMEVFFYSVSFALLSVIISDSFSIRDFWGALLPIGGNSHGFASAYLLLYLLIPFLNRMTKNLTKFQARTLLVILLYAQVLSKILGILNRYTQSLSSEILLFIMFYLISINLKRWPIKFFEDQLCCGLSFLGIWLLLVQINYLNVRGSCREIFQFIYSITVDESSLLYIIGGYTLFMFFRKLNILSNKYINMIATINLGVLLIHDHNYFRNILWNDILKCSQWYYSPYFVFEVIGCVLAIYIVCGCFDVLRQYYIEIPLMKYKKLLNICERMDGKINDQ